MNRRLNIALIGGLGIIAVGSAQSKQNLAVHSATAPGSSSAMAGIPPMPKGKSTVFGGRIQAVDPVRDELTLDASGMHPMKILYDERTQAYRDGAKIRLIDLRPAQHVSIQTALDGDKVFAISIHILSQPTEGDYEGRVLSYRPTTGELTIAGGMSGEPFRVFVSKDTAIAREGQREFSSVQSGVSDLASGTLVSVGFKPDGGGRGVADHISILATPGALFTFVGTISDLDLPGGFFVLASSQEDKSYRIFFDSAHTKGIQDLHPGDRLRVSARYDGARYVSSGVTAQ